VHWNTDKHYLVHLAKAGVPVVPTRFVEPGAAAETELAAFLRGGPGGCTVGGAHAFDEFVVKPAIGAGSRDAARYERSEASAALQHLERLIGAGRSVMLQPYLARVDAQGETAALYLGGGFSHAIRKGPLLRRGAGLVEGLFAPEDIGHGKPRRPSCPSPPRPLRRSVRSAGLRSYRPHSRRHGCPRRARTRADRAIAVLAHAPGAAERLARHLVQRLHASRTA